jgi:shikimate 5-dehydrogenase
VIDGATRVFALLGDPVAHSLSPAMQNAAFRALGLPRCTWRSAVTPMFPRSCAASLAPV